MAGSSKDSIFALLCNNLEEKTAQNVAQKLAFNKYTVATLLDVSERELDEILAEEFPEAAKGERWGVKVAISSHKRKLAQGSCYISKKQKVMDSEEITTTDEDLFSHRLPLLENLPDMEDLEKVLKTPVKVPVEQKLYNFFSKGLSKNLYVARGRLKDVAVCISAIHLLRFNLSEGRTTSSHWLALITGDLLRMLDKSAPPADRLSLRYELDSIDEASTTSTHLQIRRPDLQVFVRGAILARWENKKNEKQLSVAIDENINKMKTWNPLYYGNIPYVIGGACAGAQFQWLVLFPGKNGKPCYKAISRVYDLTDPEMALVFIGTVMNVYCVLQKLAGLLPTFGVPCKLYSRISRENGNLVEYGPNSVLKSVPFMEEDRFELLKEFYASIKGNPWLVQAVNEPKLSPTHGYKVELNPVGNPVSHPQPSELRWAVHDVLCGLKELHKNNFTHRDLRWQNVVKVPGPMRSKWVIIDMESVGRDKEAVNTMHVGWDDDTLESELYYTKASDMYEVGKLMWTQENEMAEDFMTNRLQVDLALEKYYGCKGHCDLCQMFS